MNVNKKLKEYDDKESMKYSVIYNVWLDAVINMAKDKGYFLK